MCTICEKLKSFVRDIADCGGFTGNAAASLLEDIAIHQKAAGKESNSTPLLNAKGRAKLFIDANVWDGEDRSGCDGDSARFTPDELQELIDDMLEHLSI